MRERHTQEWVGEGQRERERENPKQTPYCLHRAQHSALKNHEIITWAKIKTWVRNQLSNSGTLKIFYCGYINLSNAGFSTEKCWGWNISGTSVQILSKLLFSPLKQLGLRFLYWSEEIAVVMQNQNQVNCTDCRQFIGLKF